MKLFKTVSLKKILSILLVITLCLVGINMPIGKELKGNTKVSVMDEIATPSISENKLTDISKEALSDGEEAAKMVNKYEDNVDYEAALNYALTAYYTNEDFEEMSAFVANIDNRGKEIVENYKLAAEERASGTSNGYVPGEAIVLFDENTTEEEINAVAEAEYGTCKEVVELFNGEKMAVMSISLGQTVDMAVDAYDDYSVTNTASANDIADVCDYAADGVNDTYVNKQYYLDYINAKGAWDYITSVEYEKVLVGVIDTGVQLEHPDLENILSPYSADVTGDEIVLLSECENTYNDMHGTFVSGIIAAEANNNSMTAGVASTYNNDVVEILAIQASYIDEDGGAKFQIADLMKAVNYCVEQNVKVINMSLGSYSDNCSYDSVLQSARVEGVTIVASAGNKGISDPHFPSDSNNVIGVVATNKDMEKASFSNYGLAKDVCAPGEGMYSTTVEGKVTTGQGTSYASPVVAAVVAMMYAVNDNMTFDKVSKIIKLTSIDIGLEEYCNNGLINALGAVKLADDYSEDMFASNNNLALNKTVTVSEGSSVSETSYPASNLVDGNKDTRWITSTASNKTIIIDLEDEFSVDNVLITYSSLVTCSFNVYVSVDGNEWEDVSANLSSPTASTRKINVGLNTRYVKLVYDVTQNIVFTEIEVFESKELDSSYTSDDFELLEPKVNYNISDVNLLSIDMKIDGNKADYTFNVYIDGFTSRKNIKSSIGIRVPVGTINMKVTSSYFGKESQGVNFEFLVGDEREVLSERKPAYASSQEWDGTAAKYAVDNSAGTRWASLATDDEWIYVDLEQVYSVSKVELDWESAYGKAYDIQVSNDATNWNTVKSITDSDGGEDIIEFDAIDARYVRVKGVQRATGYGYSLWNFDVYGKQTTGNTGDTGSGDTGSGDTGSDTDTPVNVNLAANMTAYSSSNEGDNVAASNAFDTNKGTRWSSQFTDDEWVYVDLGQEYTVDKAVLFWEGAYGKDYNIDVSTDGTNWTTVSELRNQDGGEDVVTFDATTARYVRMSGVARGTGYGYSLWEMEVYCTVENSGNGGSGNNGGDQDDNKTSEIISNGKNAVSSSNEADGMNASKAFDGDTGSRWASAWTDNEWVYVDLGQTYTVDKVVLNWEGAYGKDYNIDVSTDGTNWTTIKEMTNQDGGEDVVTFDATNARYVRMTGVTRGTGYGYSLFEMSVFGY